jgi:hypothetical protein
MDYVIVGMIMIGLIGITLDILMRRLTLLLPGRGLLIMGHILVKNLRKSYPNRRLGRRGAGDPYDLGGLMHILDIPHLEFQEK